MDIDNFTIKQAQEAIATGKAIEKALGATPARSQETGSSVGDALIGKYVIVRCKDAGVHSGVLDSCNGRSCILTESRRLWRWRVPMGASEFLSGVAVYGLADDCKIGCTVDRIMLTESCEIIACTFEAEKSIREFATWTRSN